MDLSVIDCAHLIQTFDSLGLKKHGGQVALKLCIGDNRWIICPLPTQPEPSSSSAYTWRRVPVLNIPSRRRRIGLSSSNGSVRFPVRWCGRTLSTHTLFESRNYWQRAGVSPRLGSERLPAPGGTSLDVIGASRLSLIASRVWRRHSKF